MKEEGKMLVDRYQAEDVFARVPQMAERIDPVLKELDQRLPDDAVYRQVRADFGKRYRYTLVHGRHSTPVEVLLRLLIVKHLYQWSYQDTEEQVDQNLILRWFCRLYWAPVPDDTTLIRWANTLQPETLHALNDRVVQLAVQAKVTKGRKLRLDATCVQTNIHHPTDSGLLVDSVRMLSRFVQRAKGLIKDQVSNVEQICRSRLRSARQVAQRLHRQLRRKGEDKEAQQKELYQKLIQTAEQMVQQSRRVVVVLGKQTQRQAQRLLEQAQRVLPLVERVILQTRTRVLEGRSVASGQKVLSLFEPHTRAIPRHKGGALVEFGRQVILDEVDGGIVTRYQILEHPNEHGQAVEAVAHHQALFEHPPNLVAGDRGVHSPDTEEQLSAAGVKLMAIPAVGKGSAVQQTRSFKRGYRWRAGIEGRIASLRRDFGWRRCAYHGPDGMERWLGLGVIASNLRRMALAKEA
jgi:IS5 family transposase